jgi:transmembrane sensor
LGGGVCHPHVPTDHPPSIADFDPGLLDRYLAGRAGSAESARIDAVLAADPAVAEEVAALRVALAAGLPHPADPAALARRAQAIREQVDAGRGDLLSRGARPHANTAPALLRPRRAGIVAATCAATCIALGLGVAVGALRSSARARASRAGREYATAAGQRLSVTLVDGTQLTLAPASHVRVASDRDIELEGEGYFRVVHDAAHPFTVRTHGAIARDVGTAFDVRAYPEDAGAWIAVADGAVAIGARASCHVASRPPCEIQAQMGDVATVAADMVTVTHGVDVTALTSWARGMLTFTDTPLRNVVIELRRWYGADVEIANQKLAERRVTIAFGKEPVGDAVTFLAATAGAVVERHGATIVLRMASPRK